MSDLEQRLADELGLIATDLRTPDLEVPGLVAAGRREQVRTRAAIAAAVGVVAAAVLAVTVVLPAGDSSPQPARPAPTTGTDDALGRALELPWAAEGVLHVDGAEIEVEVDRLLHAHGVTVVEHEGSWSLVEGDRLTLLTSMPLSGDPVIGTDGTVVWLEDHPGDPRLGDPEAGPVPVQYFLSRQSGGKRMSSRAGYVLDAEITCCDAGGVVELAGVLPDGRVVLTRSGRPETWDLEEAGPEPVTGAPDDALLGSVAPWPGGITALQGGSVLAARIDDQQRWQPAWSTEGDGSGAWSADGEQYAEGARVSTQAGTTVLPLEEDDLRVAGWESPTEVVLAQWIEEDGAVTGLWRCSATELRCAEVGQDPGTATYPTGAVLLPGLWISTR